MRGPPAERQESRTSIRLDAKQGREFDGGGAVRVFGEGGYFITHLHPGRDSEQIKRLLDAPNAVPVRKHGGRLVAIRLRSVGDDRGQSSERHGRSTVTTERVRNDDGLLVGTLRTLKHKQENAQHSGTLPAWTADVRHGPVRPPIGPGKIGNP